jgi:hypothetical protein
MKKEKGIAYSQNNSKQKCNISVQMHHFIDWSIKAVMKLHKVSIA